MNIHPRLAGLFIVPYFLFGFLIEKISNLEIINHPIFFIVGVIISVLLYKFFYDRYDRIVWFYKCGK